MRLNLYFFAAALLILSSSLSTVAQAQDTAKADKVAAVTANGLPIVVAGEFAGLAPRGTATMRFLGLKVYDVTLHTPTAAALAAKPYDVTAPPLALELVYDMNFKGSDIAMRSVEEMRKQGYTNAAQLDKWQAQMTQVFPDIKRGDALIGVAIPGKEARFYNRTKLIGTIADAEFVAAFFDIWLSQKSSEPKLRDKLLNVQGGNKK